MAPSIILKSTGLAALCLLTVVAAAQQNPIDFDTLPLCHPTDPGGMIDGVAVDLNGDTFGDGTEITDQYACMGMTFSGTGLVPAPPAPFPGGVPAPVVMPPRARAAGLNTSSPNVLNSWGTGDGDDGTIYTADDRTNCCEGSIQIDFDTAIAEVTSVEFTARDIGGDFLEVVAYADSAGTMVLDRCAVTTGAVPNPVDDGTNNTHVMNVCTTDPNNCNNVDGVPGVCTAEIERIDIRQLQDFVGDNPGDPNAPRFADGYVIDDLSIPGLVPVELQSFTIE